MLQAKRWDKASNGGVGSFIVAPSYGVQLLTCSNTGWLLILKNDPITPKI